jgi:methylated-DNA-[protein]-cysteine S-methyltransferase
MSGETAAAEAGAAAPSAPEVVRVLVPSRIGPLGVEFRHTAIIRLVIAPKGTDRRRFHPFSDFEDSEFLDEVFGRLSEFLAGARRSLDLEYDLAAAELDGFARRVLRETARVPYGKTRTYKEIADAAGRPDSYRQVVSILERNPLPLLIPCHRIVPSRAGVGGWVGGAAKKRWLLKMEQESAALPV